MGGCVVFVLAFAKNLWYYISIMINKTYLALALTVLAVSFVGCAKGTDREVLVRIDRNHAITLRDFNERIAKLPERYQELIKKNKRQFLDEVIIDTILYKEAIRQRLDSDEEVKEVVEEAKKKILIARLLQNDLEGEDMVSDTEIDDYYTANKEKFAMPEVLRASHILVRTESGAKDVLDELSDGANFEELARTRSIDPSAKIDGDIGFFTKGQLVPEIEDACFEMKPGEISGVVKTKFGYHIIKLTERREPRVKELAEVRDAIKQTILRLKKRMLFQQYVAKLKEKSTISVNDKLLKKISEQDELDEKPQK